MLQRFHADKFEEQKLTCSACQWEGRGHEANIIDLYGVEANKEVHCPKCDNIIGTVDKNDDAPGESANDLSFQLG